MGERVRMASYGDFSTVLVRQKVLDDCNGRVYKMAMMNVTEYTTRYLSSGGTTSRLVPINLPTFTSDASLLQSQYTSHRVPDWVPGGMLAFLQRQGTDPAFIELLEARPWKFHALADEHGRQSPEGIAGEDRAATRQDCRESRGTALGYWLARSRRGNSGLAHGELQ